MFEPGAPVESVDAGPILAPGPFHGLPSGRSLGALYKVAAFYPGGSPGRAAGLCWRMDCFDLRESAHPDPRWAFPARRFRPVKPGDPEVMSRLLGAVPKTETVR